MKRKDKVPFFPRTRAGWIDVALIWGAVILMVIVIIIIASASVATPIPFLY